MHAIGYDREEEKKKERERANKREIYKSSEGEKKVSNSDD